MFFCKHKNGNALQALFASYKVTRRSVDELEAENERLSVGVISKKITWLVKQYGKKKRSRFRMRLHFLELTIACLNHLWKHCPKIWRKQRWLVSL